MSISKNIIFPEHFYFIYKLSKKEKGEWLNIWFHSDKKLNKQGDIIYNDTISTIKKVDKETALQLYNEIYNPVRLFTTCPSGAKFKINEKNELLYNFCAQIASIDDASYSVSFYDISLNDIEILKQKIMKWVDDKKVINGKEFIDFVNGFGGSYVWYD